MKNAPCSTAIATRLLTTAVLVGCTDPRLPDAGPDSPADQASDSTTEDAREDAFDYGRASDTALEDSALDARGDGHDSATRQGPLPGEVGAPCSTSDDCKTAACIPDRKHMVCAANTGMDICSTSAGAVRVIYKPVGDFDPWHLCVSLAALLGVPCQSDDDCHFETAEFVSTWTHPWRCRDVTATNGLVAVRQCVAGCQLKPTCTSCGGSEEGGCVPEDIIPCPYYGVASKVSGPCTRTNDFGTCPGASVCADIGAAPACDAPEPTTETCAPNGKGDNIDQDCDGQTDEGCAP